MTVFFFFRAVSDWKSYFLQTDLFRYLFQLKWWEIVLGESWWGSMTFCPDLNALFIPHSSKKHWIEFKFRSTFSSFSSILFFFDRIFAAHVYTKHFLRQICLKIMKCSMLSAGLLITYNMWDFKKCYSALYSMYPIIVSNFDFFFGIVRLFLKIFNVSESPFRDYM